MIIIIIIYNYHSYVFPFAGAGEDDFFLIFRSHLHIGHLLLSSLEPRFKGEYRGYGISEKVAHSHILFSIFRLYATNLTWGPVLGKTLQVSYIPCSVFPSLHISIKYVLIY